jgi:tetratricopeptide (TPR) repeat protein
MQPFSTQDKLRVFVSSTISECVEERKFAAAGIRATNHEPILFEKLGARPYHPRHVYLSRLQQSQIVVAIYKDSYGYIDSVSGMTISGLEDEYRSARRVGKPVLVFINKNASSRDDRLRVLIEEIMSSDETVAFYEEPTELEELVKDSVTAIATQRFLDADALEKSTSISSDAINQVAAPPGGFIERPDLIEAIDQMLRGNSVVRVEGAGGLGKTVLLTQFAKTNSLEIVWGRHLSPKELFGVLANKLRDLQSDQVQQFATYEGARLAFISAWIEATSKTLVIDDSEHVEAVLDAISEIDHVSHRESNAIIYTARGGRQLRHFESALAVPPMRIDQISMILERSGRHIASTSPQEVFERTAGNPLLIRQEIVSSGKTAAEILRGLNSRTREIATYLTVAGRSLSVGDLLALRGDTNYLAGDLISDVEHATEIVVGTGDGFQIVHERIRSELYEVIKEKPEWLQFIAGRIGRHFSNERRFIEAYFILADANHKSAGRLLEKASFEAGRSGDWSAGLRLAQASVAHAVEMLDQEAIVISRLSLAQSYQMTGQINLAIEEIKQAQVDAETGSEELRLHVEGFQLTFEALHALTHDALSRLAAHKNNLLSAGKRWQAARVAVDLSAAYINVRNDKSEAEARFAVQIFEEVGDDYGLDIARRNLASALLAQTGKEIEADDLIRSIERKTDVSDQHRSRAWLCNLLVRKNRRAGRLSEAEAYAMEAIELGKRLGDAMLEVINLIGLGNVLSDAERYQEAIAAYNAAALGAQKCRRYDSEAHASYLAADTYNEIPKGHALEKDAPVRAENLARHAIGLLKGTVSIEHLSRAYKSLSDALFTQGRRADAIEALFFAASHKVELKDWDGFEEYLMTACHNLDVKEIGLYIKGLNTVLGREIKLKPDATVLEVMFEPIPSLLRLLPSATIIPFFGFHLARLVNDLPVPVTRRVVDLIFSSLIEVFKERPHEEWRLLFPTLVMAAGCAKALTIYDYVRIGEAVSDQVIDLLCQPEMDGGARWIVTLSLSSPVAISIVPVDNKESTALAGLLLALFLKGFETELARDLFQGVRIGSELSIMIGESSSLPEDIQKHVNKSLKDRSCVVSRPNNIHDDSPDLPTNVFLSDSFLDELIVGKGRGGALQLLLGMTLIEVSFRLLRGAVDLDVLTPKVVQLVRRSIS